MAFLSKTKLEFFKFRKKYTNQKISQLTGIPISSIDKIFSGNNKNPTFETISEIARILDCSIDDLIDSDQPISPYYSEKELAKLSQKINENNSLKLLLDKAINLNENDINLLNNLIERFFR